MVAYLSGKAGNMEKDLEQLLENSKESKSLHPDDIPALDLYMDQIIALMSAHLGDENNKEPLTRTMIHNYSKAGLISPVKGKKYTKKQILQMLAIYSLKNTLSIAQINRVLSALEQAEVGEAELAQCFDTQLARRETVNTEITQALGRKMEEYDIKVDTPEDALSVLLTLTDIISTLTRFATAITETYFPDPPQKKKK